jgi:signal transduction histidine kinase
MHGTNMKISIDNVCTDNIIHVLVVPYGLRVEIKESKKIFKKFIHVVSARTFLSPL